ncbi:MAG: hypothetical protein CL779_03070 [Chloroflexi bacterium]|nr:hypothetical protein [Chloroflexota bacterium]
MTYINEQLLTTNLSISSNEINKNIDNTIRNKLKDQIEGLCFEDGYIVKDSVKIIKKSMGKIVVNNNISSINYPITYTAMVISPTEGDEIQCYVSNINKMGIIAYIKLSKEDDTKDSPIIIMVPKEYFNESTLNFDDIHIGQTLNIIVVGTRIKYYSERIQVIGKPM